MRPSTRRERASDDGRYLFVSSLSFLSFSSALPPDLVVTLSAESSLLNADCR